MKIHVMTVLFTPELATELFEFLHMLNIENCRFFITNSNYGDLLVTFTPTGLPSTFVDWLERRQLDFAIS